MLTQTTSSRPIAASRRHLPPSRGIGEEPQTLGDAFALLGVTMRFQRNAEIYGEGEPAEQFYKVVTGAVRSSKLLHDGRRQIGAFHLPGDIFGLEEGLEHSFSAEAVSDCTIVAADRNDIVALAAKHGGIAHELWSATATSLRGAQEHMLLLGRKTAEERVASFLLKMASNNETDRIELPMGRQDIADYLGLTIETVSRTLTHLRFGAIAFSGARRIHLKRPNELKRLNA